VEAKTVWADILGGYTGVDIKRGLEACRVAAERFPPGAGLFAARCRSVQPGSYSGGAPLPKSQAVTEFNRLLSTDADSTATAAKYIAMCRRVLAKTTTRTLEGAQEQGRDHADMTVEEARANVESYARGPLEDHHAAMREHYRTTTTPDAWRQHTELCDCQRCERAKGFRP
jgi:hypothetical protein